MEIEEIVKLLEEWQDENDNKGVIILIGEKQGKMFKSRGIALGSATILANTLINVMNRDKSFAYLIKRTIEINDFFNKKQSTLES